MAATSFRCEREAMASQPLLPPSLNKLPGVTTPGCIRPGGRPDCGLEHCIDRPGVLLKECSAKGKLRQLEQAIRELLLREGAGDVEIENAARSLLMATWEAQSVRGMAQRHLRKSDEKGKWGRPREEVGDYVSTFAALDYEKLTVSRVSRKIVSDAWKSAPPAPHGWPYGEWHNFLKKVFLVLGIDAKADGVNQRLQADLKAIQAKLSGKF
jgi:hypothetical protein